MKRVKFKAPPVDRRRGNDDIRQVLIMKHMMSDWQPYIDTLNQIIEWDHYMPRKTYRIELKADFDADDTHGIMLGIAKQYARDLLASAMLLQDSRAPVVALITDDSFHGTDEIELLDEGAELHQ